MKTAEELIEEGNDLVNSNRSYADTGRWCESNWPDICMHLSTVRTIEARMEIKAKESEQ